MPNKVKNKLLPERAPKCHVRSGDKVVVIAGKNKGKQGTVIRVFPLEQRALVDGDAAVYQTKHVRADPQRQKEGGRIQRLRPIHVSNLMLLDPTTNKATRVRHEKDDQGRTVRVAIKSGHRFPVSNKV